MTPPRVRRRLLRVAVAGVLLAFALAVMLWMGRPPAAAVLPNPNGYDKLLEAGESLVGSGSNVSELDHQQLGSLVATNARAVAVLRFGLSQDCAVPTELVIQNFPTASGDLIKLKALAMALFAEGRFAEMENRFPQAAQSYTDAVRLGKAMSHGGLMIHRLVGIACEAIGESGLVRIGSNLRCEDLPPLVSALERLDLDTVSWREVMQQEGRFAWANSGSSPNPMRIAWELWQTRGQRRKAEERHDTAVARGRLLMVEFALRAYQCDQGKAPTELAQLVPKYLKRVPQDPFGSGPLAYRASATNWILYSYGPDRTDNGGEPMRKKPLADDLTGAASLPMKGDLLFDSKW